MKQARDHIEKTIAHLKNNRKVLENRIEQTHQDAVKFAEQIAVEDNFLQELEAIICILEITPKIEKVVKT